MKINKIKVIKNTHVFLDFSISILSRLLSFHKIVTRDEIIMTIARKRVSDKKFNGVDFCER